VSARRVPPKPSFHAKRIARAVIPRGAKRSRGIHPDHSPVIPRETKRKGRHSARSEAQSRNPLRPQSRHPTRNQAQRPSFRAERSAVAESTPPAAPHGTLSGGCQPAESPKGSHSARTEAQSRNPPHRPRHTPDPLAVRSKRQKPPMTRSFPRSVSQKIRLLNCAFIHAIRGSPAWTGSVPVWSGSVSPGSGEKCGSRNAHDDWPV
jgi:hypothetical protein